MPASLAIGQYNIERRSEHYSGLLSETYETALAHSDHFLLPGLMGESAHVRWALHTATEHAAYYYCMMFGSSTLEVLTMVEAQRQL